MEKEIIENAEESFQGMAKSSVKLIKNSKGINWEIKVVKGEEGQLEGLMQMAIKCHKELILEIGEDGKNKY